MTPPRILYAYQPVGEPQRERGIFAENTVWFSTPDRFNDPFEGRPVIVANPDYRPSRALMMKLAAKNMPGATRNERRRAASQQMQAYDDPHYRRARSEELRRRMLNLFQGSSIACFTPKATDIRMWSYYASKHQGYCVGFSFDEPWIWEDSHDRSRVRLWPMSVTYSTIYPVIDADADWDDPKEQEILFDKAVLSKAEEWKSEDEWRCVRSGEPAGPQPYPPSALREVIFGARIDPGYRATLIELVLSRHSPVNMFDAVMAPDRFEIRLQPLP